MVGGRVRIWGGVALARWKWTDKCVGMSGGSGEPRPGAHGGGVDQVAGQGLDRRGARSLGVDLELTKPMRIGATLT
jgi:hypothetical protein